MYVQRIISIEGVKKRLITFIASFQNIANLVKLSPSLVEVCWQWSKNASHEVLEVCVSTSNE